MTKRREEEENEVEEALKRESVGSGRFHPLSLVRQTKAGRPSPDHKRDF